MGRQSRLRTIKREVREAVQAGRVDINWANDGIRELKGRSVERQGLCVQTYEDRMAGRRATFTKEKAK